MCVPPPAGRRALSIALLCKNTIFEELLTRGICAYLFLLQQRRGRPCAQIKRNQGGQAWGLKKVGLISGVTSYSTKWQAALQLMEERGLMQ